MSVTQAVHKYFEVEVVQDGPLTWKEGGDVLRVYTCKYCSWKYEVMVIHPSHGRANPEDVGEELRDHLMFGCSNLNSELYMDKDTIEKIWEQDENRN
jgi:hypothetical protein